MKRGGGISGAVSLVTIFCVLCLAVFAVLTLSTADRERRLSELAAERAADYYEADRVAVEHVAALRRAGEVGVRTFAVPFGEDQALAVEVELSGGEAEILRWAAVYAGDWEIDDTIEIWDGGFL